MLGWRVDEFEFGQVLREKIPHDVLWKEHTNDGSPVEEQLEFFEWVQKTLFVEILVSILEMKAHIHQIRELAPFNGPEREFVRLNFQVSQGSHPRQSDWDPKRGSATLSTNISVHFQGNESVACGPEQFQNVLETVHPSPKLEGNCSELTILPGDDDIQECPEETIEIGLDGEREGNSSNSPCGVIR